MFDRLGLAYRRVSARFGIREMPNWGIGRPPLDVRVRRVGVSGVAPTDRVCRDLRTVRSPGVEVVSGIDRSREHPRSAIPIEFASPARRQVLSHMRHLLLKPSVPLRRPPEGRGARTPGRSNRQAPGATEGQRHRAGLSTLLEVRDRPRSRNQ